MKNHNLLKIIENNSKKKNNFISNNGVNDEMVNWEQCAHSWTRGYYRYAFIVGGLASEFAIFCRTRMIEVEYNSVQNW